MEKLFGDQLNAILCALEHLEGNLKDMAELASFEDLKFAFEENLDETSPQILRVKSIITDLNFEVSKDSCLAMAEIIDEAYDAIKRFKEKSIERDMALLFYSNIIKHVEIAAYQMMKILADELKYKEASYKININLDETYDNNVLFKLITKEYIIKKLD